MNPNLYIGQPVSVLPTPSLIIDLDKLQNNLRIVQESSRQTGVPYRPHIKSHKTLELAKLQLEAGAAGHCCATIEEMEMLVNGGIRKGLLLTSEIAGKEKIDRVIKLAAVADIQLVFDHPDQVHAVGQASDLAKVVLGALVDIDVGQGRCGVRSKADALKVVEALLQYSNSLRIDGLQGYNGAIPMIPSYTERTFKAKASGKILLDIEDALIEQGITINLRTGGGTGTLSIDQSGRALNETQPGSYIFMDTRYVNIEWNEQQKRPPFQQALTVLTTVVSQPSSDTIFVDAGWKGISSDGGLPLVKDHSDCVYNFSGDEHGIVTPSNPQIGFSHSWNLGEKVELFPSHCDTTIVLHKAFFVVRDQQVVHVWPITGR